ncbi:MAG: WYL domain-containing protein [Tepidisphaeraceae bacterium]
MALLDVIQDAGRQHHLLDIEYERPGSPPVRRLVEPYRLQSHQDDLMLLGWQVVPEVEERLHWRNFRLDRIRYATDSGHSFEPRAPMQLDLPSPLNFDFRPDPSAKPMLEYRKQLDVILLDTRMTDEQFDKAGKLKQGLPLETVRAEHARALARLIDDLIEDDRLTDEQSSYLSTAMEALCRLGWSPG